MAKATSQNTTASRFDNLSAEQLADKLGHADAVLKAAEREVDAIKAEIKARRITDATGTEFSITVREQIAGRLDSKAVKTFLGDSWRQFETAVISTVIRIKDARSVDAALAA